jgi:8-oxo-dGTP pyrophosphatase MutT (NUDIX family)
MLYSPYMTTETIPEFGTPRENEERRDGGCGIVFDPTTQKYAVGKQFESGALRFFSGGVSADEDIQEGVLREVVEESGLHNFKYVEKIGAAQTHYYNTLRKVNRVAKATCFLVILENTDLLPVELEEHETFSLVWVSAQELLADFTLRNDNKDNDHWIYFLKKGVKRAIELGYDRTSTN